MIRLYRFLLPKFALYGALTLCSAARAEPSPIGGLSRQTPTAAPAPGAVLSTAPSRSVQVTFSGPRTLSAREQVWAGPLGGHTASAALTMKSDPCSSCLVEHVAAPCGGCKVPDSPEPDSTPAVDLAGFSVLIRDPSGASAASLGAPSLARFRGKLAAGSFVRYVFESLHTVGVLQPLDGEAVISVEDCAGNTIATASPVGASSVLDAYSVSGAANCRVFLIQSRSAAAFELTTYNFW